MDITTAEAETTPPEAATTVPFLPDLTTMPDVPVNENNFGGLGEEVGDLDKVEHQRSPLSGRKKKYPSSPSHETQVKVQSRDQNSSDHRQQNTHHHHHHHHHRHSPHKNDTGSPKVPSKQQHHIPPLPVSPKDTLSRLLPSTSPSHERSRRSSPNLPLEEDANEEQKKTTIIDKTTTIDAAVTAATTTTTTTKGLTNTSGSSNSKKSVGVYVRTALAMSKLKHSVQQQHHGQKQYHLPQDEEGKKQTTVIPSPSVTTNADRIRTVDVDGIKVHPKDFIYGSLTRTSDLETSASQTKGPYWTLSKIENSVHDPSRKNWEAGDYVVGRYINPTHHHVYSGPLTSVGDFIELPTGRHRFLQPGDVVVGVLGRRQATQELCGDFSLVEHPNPDGETILDDLDGAGMFGRTTSISTTVSRHGRFIYEGHVMKDTEHGGRKVTMNDFVVSDDTVPPVALPSPRIPTVLVLGTSMSVGKSSVCRSIIRTIKNLLEGSRHESGVGTNSRPPAVIGAKLTGAGYMNDLYSYLDAGASAVVDFVDAGLPSTVMPREEYRHRLHKMYGIIASKDPSCVVIEAGASPIENYNGDVVLESFAYASEAKSNNSSIEKTEDGEISTESNVLRKIKHDKTIPAHSWSSSSMSNHLTDESEIHSVPTANNRNLFVILCATDVFSVVAAKSYLRHFEIAPDLVSGIVANTKAGQELVRRLTGIVASSLNDDKSVEEFEELLNEKLDLREWRNQQQQRSSIARDGTEKNTTVLGTCATESSTKRSTAISGNSSSVLAPLSPREERQLRQRL